MRFLYFFVRTSELFSSLHARHFGRAYSIFLRPVHFKCLQEVFLGKASSSHNHGLRVEDVRTKRTTQYDESESGTSVFFFRGDSVNSQRSRIAWLGELFNDEQR
jgi:hypothetical protein